MNQRQKDFILADINGQTFDNLLNWLIEKEFLIEQYEAHNLNVAQLETVRKAYAKKQAEKAIQDSLDNNSKALLEEIRRGKKSAWEIKDLLLEGKVTEQSLIDEAGLMPEIVQKIMRLTREAVDFNEWKNLPPLLEGRMDVYFLGLPSSGKTCVLASLFKYLTQEGYYIENPHSIIGNRFKNQLTRELRAGTLPLATGVGEDSVNYICLELRNRKVDALHRLNFIEMSGEKFRAAYRVGIKHINSKGYLFNKNEKLIFFIIDHGGEDQASEMTSVLALMDKEGVLAKTRLICFCVTKCDTFPPGEDRYDYADKYIDSNYKILIENCLEARRKHDGLFDIVTLPFTMGDILLKDLLVRHDEKSPEMLTRLIMRYSPYVQQPWWKRLGNKNLKK